MKISLDQHETRVIASLIEKELTTPDQYPLSLNALVNACNQKSNRHPVTNLDETEVQACLDRLIRRHLVMEKTGFGSRVPKFQQRFCNSEFGVVQFSPPELALVCELMLRGPQTPGELRAHADRLNKFRDVPEVEDCLAVLAAREDGPVVQKLTREPGRREARYAQLFTEGQVLTAHPTEEPEGGGVGQATTRVSAEMRLQRVEHEVESLRQELESLKARLGE